MMDILEIKKHVTYLSEELKCSASHKEEVVVGGKAISYVPPISEEFPFYVFILDDYIGNIHVHVPTEIVLENPEIEVGRFLFFEGYVNVIRRQIQKEVKKEISVFAYDVKDISIIGDINK